MVAMRALLQLATLFRLVAGQGSKELVGHSITSPPNIYKLSSDWFMAGTVIPSEKSLVLSPGVPGRVGLFWSGTPLLTNDFEVAFTFTSEAPAKRTARDDGFAFWYVYENATQAQEKIADEHIHNQDELISNTWSNALLAEKFDIFGYRSLFDGVGVFFADGNVDNALQPTVSAVSNNGKLPYRLHMGIPAADAMKYDFRTGKEVSVKIRIKPDGAKVEVEGGGSYDVKAEFKAGGYLGFSIFGGQKGDVDPKEKSDVVKLMSMKVTNFDISSQGEDVKDVDETPISHENLLEKTSSFADHRAESDAIKDLTNMVFKLVVESQPMRNQMLKAIETLGKRVGVMEKSFEQLKQELDKKTGHKLGEEFQQIKKELTSLSKVATTETQERHKRLETLHADISTVHESASKSDNIDKHLDRLTESNQKTLESLTNEHQKMFGVSVSAIAFIIIAGLSLYNKFRCWEKKHVL